MMIAGISHIYIICDGMYEPERYHYLTNWLSESLFPSDYYSFELYCWKSTITDDDLRQYNIDGPISTSEKSLIINYMKVLEKFINSSYEHVLILESDVFTTSSNWINDLEELLGKVKNTNNWDMFQIGTGCYTKPTNYGHTLSNGNDVYACPAANCTEAIIWTRSAAEKTLNNMMKTNKITEPLDIRFNSVIRKERLRMYWGYPPIFIQGSGDGRYVSSIEHT